MKDKKTATQLAPYGGPTIQSSSSPARRLDPLGEPFCSPQYEYTPSRSEMQYAEAPSEAAIRS